MKNRTSISSHQNSFMDIDAMAKPATTTSAITTSSNTSQTAFRKSPRLMKNGTSISSHRNSFMDIDAMAKLSFDKRKSKKDYDKLSFDDGDSTDTNIVKV
jgi:hypothetical protein